MSWKPIVVGVDASPEGVHAAHVGARLARDADSKCLLVHAVRDPWSEGYLNEVPMDLSDHNRRVLESVRQSLLDKLKGQVPEAVRTALAVSYGRTGAVLAQVAGRNGAEVIVLGGKRHTTLDRWVAGSTAHYLVRAHDYPVLILGDQAAASEEHFRRVIAAVDLSPASHAVIQAAERFARLARGHLAALHVVEPYPIPPSILFGMETDPLALAGAELERSVWPQFRFKAVEHMIRRGPAAETIIDGVQEWGAELLVVGSHGRGWVDRLLLGSVTERLLNRLPTSLLVVPVPSPGEVRRAPRRATHRSSRRKSSRR
jgi:nucleotide-binding universal stress UspA family protein